MDTVQVTSVPHPIDEKERLPYAGAAGAGSAPLLDQGDTIVPGKLVQHAFCKFGLNDFAIYSWPK